MRVLASPVPIRRRARADDFASAHTVRRFDGALDISIGRPTIISPAGTTTGFAVNLDLGFAPTTGFDVARPCRMLAELVQRSYREAVLWGLSGNHRARSGASS